MVCNYPLTRIETYDGKVSFTGSYIKDAEASKSFGHKLENGKNIKSVTMIPCGQCISCRLNRSRDWANRVMCEAEQYENNYFITLTYADEFLPIKRSYNQETGEIITGFTLKKEDLQKFNHDLRQYWERKFNHIGIRYYECGEYGSENLRPHYHAIIFNLPYLDDLKLYRITDTGDQLYTSETISKIWRKGYVVIGEVTWESASYVARYVLKKKFGKEADAYYMSMAKIPEFTTMSLRPGIGYNYYEENKKTIYSTDEIFIKGKNGIIGTRPSKYFDRLYEQENPEHYKKIKRSRANKNRLNTLVTLDKVITTENIQVKREINGNKIKERTKALKREL